MKVIKSGELDKAVKLKGIAVTKGAREAIEKAGGSIEANGGELATLARRPQQNPADIAKAASKLGELKARFLFLIGALIVFALGTYIPVPGVDPVALNEFFEQQAGGLLGMVNLFSGGALSRFGIFAMGIMPYISSSIIMQMASHIRSEPATAP